MPVRAYAAKSAKGKLEPFEYEPGPRGPEDVEVRVTHCGICHSDVAMIDNDWGWSRYPLVPGHEVIGTVAAVGSQVKYLAVGQRVGIGWSSGSCGHCEWCTRGKEMLCAEEKATIVGRHGGFASSVRSKWNYALPIPDALDSAAADMLAFSARHGIKAMIESFPMTEINKAVDHVRAGKARFRAVLVA